MKRNFILMLAVLPLVFSGCSEDDKDRSQPEKPTLAIIVAKLNDKLSTGEIIEQQVECMFVMYKLNENTTLKENQSSLDLLKGYIIGSDGTSFKQTYAFFEKDGSVVEKIDYGRYAVFIMIDETLKYTYKVFDFKENETTEIKKVFESIYPRAHFEEW